MTIVQGTSFMYVAYDAQGRSGAKPVTDERVRERSPWRSIETRC